MTLESLNEFNKTEVETAKIKKERIEYLLDTARNIFSLDDNRFKTGYGNFHFHGEMELQTVPYIQTPVFKKDDILLAIRQFKEPNEIYSVLVQFSSNNIWQEYACFDDNSIDISIFDNTLQTEEDFNNSADEILDLFDNAYLCLAEK